MDNINESNFTIKNIIKNIKNYFINNNIIIEDDDENSIKIKKFLLKYKRIIGLVLLVILLIIGYNYNLFDIENNNIENKKSNIKQNGGKGAPKPPKAPKAPKAPPAPKVDAAAAAGADPGAAAAAAGAAGGEEKKEKEKKEKKEKSPSSGTSVLDGASRKVGATADILYQILFAIAMLVVTGVVLVPSISLIAIGIVCYVLLKDKMKVIKGF
jgi:hypothetical protein